MTALILAALRPIADETKWRGKIWADYDDPLPGYSECLMWRDKIPAWSEEEDAKAFVFAHREFFFDGEEPSRRRLAVIWPRLKHYVELYKKTTATDTDAAAREMNGALKEAKQKPLVWPPK